MSCTLKAPVSAAGLVFGPDPDTKKLKSPVKVLPAISADFVLSAKKP